MLSFLCTCTIIFERCGYTSYLCLGNGDIRSIYLFLYQFLSVLFWGTTSRPVGVAYHLYIFVYGSLLLLSLVWLDISWLEMWLVRSILLCICIIGGWDWPGVGIGVPICTDCLVSSIRRPVPIFGPGGLLSVK